MSSRQETFNTLVAYQEWSETMMIDGPDTSIEAYLDSLKADEYVGAIRQISEVVNSVQLDGSNGLIASVVKAINNIVAPLLDEVA